MSCVKGIAAAFLSFGEAIEDTISGFPILFILRPCSVQKISAKPNGRAAKKQPDRKLHGSHGVFGKLLHRGAGRRHPTRPQEENTLLDRGGNASAVPNRVQKNG